MNGNDRVKLDILLGKGVNINACSTNYLSGALSEAMSRGHGKTALKLLDHGADVRCFANAVETAVGLRLPKR